MRSQYVECVKGDERDLELTIVSKLAFQDTVALQIQIYPRDVDVVINNKYQVQSGPGGITGAVYSFMWPIVPAGGAFDGEG